MRIGVLGSGDVGRSLGRGFAGRGDEVRLGTRHPEKDDVQKWVSETPRASAGTFADTAAWGELVVLATLGRAAEEAIKLAGPNNLRGKVVIDATNPLANEPPVNGVLRYTVGANDSLGERVQRQAPEARVVKAFNTVGNAHFVHPKFPGGPPTMFYCGNDEGARKVVAGIIKDFGWEPYDCGVIEAARALEPLCILWCLPGFLRNDWNHAFKVLQG
jgi:predicted dinucleotide-binding enzyme